MSLDFKNYKATQAKQYSIDTDTSTSQMNIIQSRNKLTQTTDF